MKDQHFSGDVRSLLKYWSDPERAEKFLKGGSRVPAVEFLLSRIEVEIHNGIWIDTAIGAGFIQSKLSHEVNPNLIIGLDFSRAMLELIENPKIAKILGSVFSIPLRKNSANIASNIFSLSDYPDPSLAFREMIRVTNKRGIISYLDYGSDDGYWTRRQSLHGTNGNDGHKIVGNIHLRSIEDVYPYFTEQVRIVNSTTITYEVDGTLISANFNLPKVLTRCFTYVEAYKPR